MATIAITGSSGFLGTALRKRLAADGHTVVRILRGRKSDSAARWDPATGWVREGAFDSVDAVVSLSGESIGEGRWTTSRKKALMDSRVLTNRVLVDHLASLGRRPAALISASGAAYYGDRGDEELTENAPPGTGFLADLAVAWEREVFRASEAAIRTVALRLGAVMSATGGALPRMLLPFRLGLGGPLAGGKQWMAMVALEDAIGALVHAVTTDIEGPLNVTSHPATNGEFTKALGRAVHRPTFMPVPAIALRAMFGGAETRELLLASQRVLPTKLEASGYALKAPEVAQVVASALSDRDN